MVLQSTVVTRQLWPPLNSHRVNKVLVELTPRSSKSTPAHARTRLWQVHVIDTNTGCRALTLCVDADVLSQRIAVSGSVRQKGGKGPGPMPCCSSTVYIILITVTCAHAHPLARVCAPWATPSVHPGAPRTAYARTHRHESSVRTESGPVLTPGPKRDHFLCTPRTRGAPCLAPGEPPASHPAARTHRRASVNVHWAGPPPPTGPHTNA